MTGGEALRAWMPTWVRTLGRLGRHPEARQDWIYEWRRRRGGEPALPPGPIGRVLVICHGNVCHSPFGELDLARRRPGLEVRSAGLEAGEGHPAEPGARRIARHFDVDLGRHASHKLDDRDVEESDLILCMQGHQLARLARGWPGAAAKLRLLGDYLPAPPHAIEDPWGCEDAIFMAVFERIVRANARISELLGGAGR